MKMILIILFIISPLYFLAQEWEDVSLTSEINLNAVKFIDQNHGWIVGDSGMILKYENDSWTTIETEFDNYNFYGLHFTDSIHGWIIGSDGLILKYDNESVSSVNSSTNNTLNDIYMVNENFGWIGGDDRTILKFSDNNWVEYPTDNFTNVLGELINVQFLDSTFGIFIGGIHTGGDFIGFTVLSYEEGEWFEDNNETNTTALRGLFIQDKENIFSSENQNLSGSQWGSFIKYNSLTGEHEYIGSSEGICRTCAIDFGETIGWSICGNKIFLYENGNFVKFETIEDVWHLNSIDMVSDSIGWIVGDNGKILKYNFQNSGNNKIDMNLSKIFPNPVENDLIISSDDPINFVEIHNILGVKIGEIIANNENIFKLNCGFLPRGLYFIKIISEYSETIHKVIKK